MSDEITIGIDQSKRSTAIVALEGTVVLGFSLICPPAAIDGVKLIQYQWNRFWGFYDSFPKADNMVIEGLSFNAVGSGKDLLSGLNWYLRTMADALLDQFMGTVPVTMWRSKVLTKEEQSAARKAGKDGLKQAVYDKLPVSVKRSFEAYVEEQKDYILQAKDPKWKPGSKSKKYLEALWDLADAYWIAQYRASL